MKFVMASMAVAELGAYYHNCQTSIIFRLTLAEMGHIQPKTPIHCNNATAVGTNNSIKRQCLHSMEMQVFWVGGKIAQNMHDLSWYPRQKIWQITRSNITWGPTTSMSDCGIYMWEILLGTNPGLRDLAL